MKKLLSILLTVCVCLSLCVALAACDQGHKHSYKSEWSQNQTHHWHDATCEHTDKKSSYGKHVYTDDTDTTCNTCNFERTLSSDPDSLTSNQLSQLYKDVALSAWSKIGVDDPTQSYAIALSSTIPDKKTETTDENGLLNIKLNANSMAGLVYMVSLL